MLGGFRLFQNKGDIDVTPRQLGIRAGDMSRIYKLLAYFLHNLWQSNMKLDRESEMPAIAVANRDPRFNADFRQSDAPLSSFKIDGCTKASAIGDRE